MYMYNYRSHTFRDPLLVNPVTKKEVGTPPLLLLVIEGAGWEIVGAEYFNAS